MRWQSRTENAHTSDAGLGTPSNRIITDSDVHAKDQRDRASTEDPGHNVCRDMWEEGTASQCDNEGPSAGILCLILEVTRGD